MFQALVDIGGKTSKFMIGFRGRICKRIHNMIYDKIHDNMT